LRASERRGKREKDKKGEEKRGDIPQGGPSNQLTRLERTDQTTGTAKKDGTCHALIPPTLSALSQTIVKCRRGYESTHKKATIPALGHAGGGSAWECLEGLVEDCPFELGKAEHRSKAGS
jgi:hypothetical protein